MVLYIMNNYPSVTETFVATEAAAVAGLGLPVVGYALRAGTAKRSAAHVDLICPPPTRLRLLLAGLRDGPAMPVALWRARRHRLSARETARLLFAHLHAAHALRASRRAGVSHVHAHFLGRTSDVASTLAGRLECAWTATAHACDVYAPTEPRLLQMRLRSVAAVACASCDVREVLERRAGGTRVRTAVVHCGVGTASLGFFPRARGSREGRHLVTVGRLVPTKGYWTVLQSALSLMRRHRSLRWTIAGDGPLREELIRDPRYRELAPRIELVGAVDHAAVLALVSEADAFVLPCERDAQGDSDGIPVSLIEAMALGVPVVSTPIGGIPELVVPDETGFLVAPRDVGALTETIERLLYRTRPAEIERILAAAREKVEREFDTSAQAAALVELLSPYLRNGRPATAVLPAGSAR